MNKVFVVAHGRTPIGSFGGLLSGFTAVQLGTHAVKESLAKYGIDGKEVDEVFFGNVISANLGQAPAKQVALGAGLPNDVPCTLVNKVCSSGMKAIMLAAQSVQLGHNDLVVAGGMESMSNIPYYVPKARFGYKFGSQTLVDGLVRDGLENVYDQKAMGDSADITAAKLGITREDQDAYAIESYTRSKQSTESGLFADEILPFSIPQRKGDPIVMTEDEEYKKVKFEKVPALRPAFNKDGTATAANSSTLNDGASAMILCSESKMKELGLTPIAEILSYADAATEPKMFTVAPTLATPIALDRVGLSLSDVDIFEANEAFSVVALAYGKTLNIDHSQLNVLGGAVSLGHPLGASGSRIVNTMISALAHKNKEIGCAAICNGGGGASALILKKM